MTERRIMSSQIARCPDCGNSEAIVRVRGNGFAATCTACRSSSITPLLGQADLDAAMPDGPVVAPVSILRAVTGEQFDPAPVAAPGLSVRFTMPLP